MSVEAPIKPAKRIQLKEVVLPKNTVVTLLSPDRKRRLVVGKVDVTTLNLGLQRIKAESANNMACQTDPDVGCDNGNPKNTNFLYTGSCDPNCK